DRAAIGRRLLDLPMVLSLIWGVLVFSAAIGMVLHERRTDLRRWWRSGKAIILMLAVVGFVPALLADNPDTLDEQLRKSREEIAALREQIGKQRTTILDAWANLLARPEEPGTTSHGKKIRRLEEDCMDRLRGILAASFTTKRALGETDQ